MCVLDAGNDIDMWLTCEMMEMMEMPAVMMISALMNPASHFVVKLKLVLLSLHEVFIMRMFKFLSAPPTLLCVLSFKTVLEDEL